MSDLCPTCGGSVKPSSICVCGSAQSYHRPEHRRDHEYQRRYFAATPSATTGALDPELLGRAVMLIDMIDYSHTDWFDASGYAKALAAEYERLASQASAAEDSE